MCVCLVGNAGEYPKKSVCHVTRFVRRGCCRLLVFRGWMAIKICSSLMGPFGAEESGVNWGEFGSSEFGLIVFSLRFPLNFKPLLLRPLFPSCFACDRSLETFLKKLCSVSKTPPGLARRSDEWGEAAEPTAGTSAWAGTGG